MSAKSKGQLLDRIGATASAICAVHCVLTGIALGLLSSLGFGFFANPLIDFLFIGIAVSVGLVAMIHGVRRHKSWGPATVYVAGLLSVVFAHFHGPHPGHEAHNPFVHQHGHDNVSTILSVVGGLCFVGFHIWNLRLQHRHDASCACCKPLCTHESESDIVEQSTIRNECRS